MLYSSIVESKFERDGMPHSWQHSVIIYNKLTETLKVQLGQENENLAASFTGSFEAVNTKLREKFDIKMQHEIQGFSGKVDILKRDTELGIDDLTKSRGDLSEEMSTRVNAHIVQTRKELDKQGQEITTSS